MSRKEYIDYFTHIEKSMLYGMVQDDIGWHVHRAVNVDKVFTTNELADMFPKLKLLEYIRKD